MKDKIHHFYNSSSTHLFPLEWCCGGRVAVWFGEPVSDPAIVQDGGFDSHRCPATPPRRPFHRGFGERVCTNVYVAVSVHDYTINGTIGENWPSG